MTQVFEPLPQTAPLQPEWRAKFRDRFSQQHEQTSVWMERELDVLAHQRDARRRHDEDGLAGKRGLLAVRTGASQVPPGLGGMSLFTLDSGESAYLIRGEAGLQYVGLVWEPPARVPVGLVLLARSDGDESARAVETYRQQGFRVVLPSLARAQRSYADDPERKWYRFTDDELLHLFFFIAGGSLAGLEARELQTTASVLGRTLDGAPLPVILDFRGHRTLTAASAAALQPALFRLLVLHPEASALDHQESDERVNTIWGFHRDFDLLTLLALAEHTDLLFLEATPTPSAAYSRAAAWFAESGASARPVRRMVAADGSLSASALSAAFPLSAPERGPGGDVPGAASSTLIPIVHAAPPDVQTIDDLYRLTLNSKLAFLESLHQQARRRRRERFNPSALSAATYRARVAESVSRVLGPPLPETADRRVRTRLIEQRPTHGVYEVVMEAVQGVEVAGYLLLPVSGLPAPAIICQHGLGGRPDCMAGLDETWIYDRLAQRLAEKGYVTFAPFMNWGWGGLPGRDGMVKRAYALGITPNRFEVAQLHAIVDFLQSRSEVMADRIAFYGLSYGGHASVWVGSCEPRLALRVTAGHFNEWQKKLTSAAISAPQTRPTSFICVDEGYDMFYYNVLNEVGHAELVSAFAPAPHYIENGLRDTVAPTAWVDEEFDHVEAVYRWLGAAGEAVLEHFDGPHRIWSEGSFQFIHQQLGFIGGRVRGRNG